jgi:hypothetical protein
MTVSVVIFSALLAAGLVGSAMGKLTKADQVVENLTRAGVPKRWFPALAIIEIAGALGLMIGIAIAPIGIAAAIGVILYFAGALIAHLRQGDKTLGPAAFFLGLAAITLALQIATI